MTPSQALTAYLQQVRRRVGEIWTAPTQSPPQLDQIPDFDQLLAAAGKIASASPDTSAYVASVVMALLGRANCVDEPRLARGEHDQPRGARCCGVDVADGELRLIAWRGWIGGVEAGVDPRQSGLENAVCGENEEIDAVERLQQALARGVLRHDRNIAEQTFHGGGFAHRAVERVIGEGAAKSHAIATRISRCSGSCGMRSDAAAVRKVGTKAMSRSSPAYRCTPSAAQENTSIGRIPNICPAAMTSDRRDSKRPQSVIHSRSGSQNSSPNAPMRRSTTCSHRCRAAESSRSSLCRSYASVHHSFSLPKRTPVTRSCARARSSLKRHVVIDANVLVSFFVERNEKQRVAGKALLLSAEEGEIVAVVPQFALFEIADVLDSYYKVPPHTIADAIRATLTYPGVIVTDDCSWPRVLDHWPEPLTSITDSGIVAVALKNK